MVATFWGIIVLRNKYHQFHRMHQKEQFTSQYLTCLLRIPCSPISNHPYGYTPPQEAEIWEIAPHFTNTHQMSALGAISHFQTMLSYTPEWMQHNHSCKHGVVCQNWAWIRPMMMASVPFQLSSDRFTRRAFCGVNFLVYKQHKKRDFWASLFFIQQEMLSL